MKHPTDHATKSSTTKTVSTEPRDRRGDAAVSDVPQKIQAAAEELCRRTQGRELNELATTWRNCLIEDAEAILRAAKAI